MKEYPWRNLKQRETEVMDALLAGDVPTPTLVDDFRKLFASCATAPDAKEAICYHGSKALLAQIDGQIAVAIHHRDIEAKKIRRAYELEEENPTDGWSLQDYRESDIQKRNAIMQGLKEKGT